MNSYEDSSAPNVVAYVMYGITAAFLCYEMALQVSPSVLTTQLMRDLHIDAAGLGVLAGVYFYTYTAMQIPAGLLFDRYSLRWLVTFALGICVIGALSFTVTHNVFIAGMGRMLLGVGSAFAFISVLVVAARYFPTKYFALLVGIAQMLAALGAMGGEAPLSASVEHFGWRETLWGLTIFGALLTILAFIFIRSNGHKPLDESDTHPKLGVWLSLQVILKDRQTWWIALYAFTNWAPITAFTSLWGVPYLESVYNISATKAAVAIAMTWIGLAVASPLLGWLSDRIGRRTLLLSISAFIGVIASGVIIYLPNISFALMFFLLFLFGVATSGQILSFAVVRDNNKPQLTATAIGFNNMAVVAGGALFQPLVGFLLKQHWVGDMAGNLPHYQLADFQYALSIVPICFLLGLIVSLFFIKETYCMPRYTALDEDH